MPLVGLLVSLAMLVCSLLKVLQSPCLIGVILMRKNTDDGMAMEVHACVLSLARFG